MSLILIGGKSSLSKTLKLNLENKNIKYLESNRCQDAEILIDLNNINTFSNIPNNLKKAIIFAGITSIDICENNKTLANKINYLNTIKLINFEDTLIPIVHVRDNIEGFFNRSTYYNLINFALENNNIIDDTLYISSGNKNYPVGKIA